MYSERDLESIKQQYMEQDYPDDLNDHIVTCIAKASLDIAEQRTSKKLNRFLRFPAIVLLPILALWITVKYGFNINNKGSNVIQQESIENRDIGLATYSGEMENLYQIFENDRVISIYPNRDDICFDDIIYNIDKLENKVIYLKDILKDDIDYSEFDKNLRDLLGDENTKFYIDKDGTYIFLSDDTYENNIIVDRILESKILKDKYIFN